MNPHHPEQPDDAFDAEIQSLLNEQAIDADHAIQSLQAKVLNLTDPRMLSLLDEALAPQAIPDGLDQRILAATSNSIPAPLTSAAHPVVGRIGPATWSYAAAALIACAAGVGIWWSAQQAGTPQDPYAQNPATDTIGWSEAEQFASNQVIFDDTTQSIETVIQTVADDMDAYNSEGDSLWPDLDAYEQFLSDIAETGDNTPAT